MKSALGAVVVERWIMKDILKPKAISLPPAERFAFPFHIANLAYEISVVRDRLGVSPYQDFVDGLGDADYWAFEYPCGLRLLFEFIHPIGSGMNGYANVFADLPEIGHGLRHIPFPQIVHGCSTLKDNGAEINALLDREPWATSLATLHHFQVWRQGDDGNQMPVDTPTSERDAKCRVQELESHGHKQIYWYSRV